MILVILVIIVIIVTKFDFAKSSWHLMLLRTSVLKKWYIYPLGHYHV